MKTQDIKPSTETEQLQWKHFGRHLRSAPASGLRSIGRQTHNNLGNVLNILGKTGGKYGPS